MALAYTWIAYTAISAPIQYDPLGPESWPLILGLLLVAALVWRLVRPMIVPVQVPRQTLGKLAVTLVLLVAYARLFQPAGFVLSTWAFCTALIVLLGGRILPAAGFGAVAGAAVYVLCVVFLDLNLPAGVLAFLE